MKGRNVVILLLVVLIIASCAFVVVHGFTYGEKGEYTFSPIKSIKMGLDLTGGVYIVYEAADPSVEDLDTKLQGAMDIFRTRLDSKGFTEATITKQGTTKIRVEIPINSTSEITDSSEVISFISEPAKLQFLKPDGTVIMEGSAITKAEPMMTQASGSGGSQYVVSFEMSEEGAQAFEQATTELAEVYNSGNSSEAYITITLDGNVISQASVTQAISGGSAMIEGSFTQQEVQDLAMQIQSGALPLDLNVTEQRSISATLGDEALDKGVLAGIIGLCILMAFMIVVYRVPGIMADIALIAYITMTLFALALFEIQLTLPGIAGIILGIGMAVDANVIIFARFREEHLAGKSIRTSLKSGFNKATSAIIDGNVTTVIAAVVLGIFGTGSIKGFAYTLGISIVISMISALFITQMLMKLLTGIAPNGDKMYMMPARHKEETAK